MRNKKLFGVTFITLCLYTLLAVFSSSAVAKEYTEASDAVAECESALADNVKVGSRILDLFFGKDETKETYLLPGGDIFGVKIKQDRVTIADAKGIPLLKSGDTILSINGEAVKTTEDVKRILESCSGESLTIRAIHAGEEIRVEIRPKLENGEYKIGLSLRDGAAGIGTVTFIDPESGLFGGLGHGICDVESGETIVMESGDVYGVILGGIHKGECGKPGELCGILTEKDVGDLTKNDECGVFGILSDTSGFSQVAMPIARRDEVTEGGATIISTLKNGKKAEYKIEIYDIDGSSEGSKSFRIRVTDETLKALTGGIVRGMSGSPIIQNGKLVGAVTHVMVADPTEGYGIFIENMLNAAQNQVIPKAA